MSCSSLEACLACFLGGDIFEHEVVLCTDAEIRCEIFGCTSCADKLQAACVGADLPAKADELSDLS